MSERGALFALLRHVRFRLRLLAAVRAGLAGLGACAAGLLVLATGHHLGWLTLMGGTALAVALAGAALLGATVATLLPVGWTGCARRVDDAVSTDGDHNGDRVLIAVGWLRERNPPADVWQDAHVRHTWRSVARLRPRDVVAWRWGRGHASALVVAGLAMGAAAWPVRNTPAAGAINLGEVTAEVARARWLADQALHAEAPTLLRLVAEAQALRVSVGRGDPALERSLEVLRSAIARDGERWSAAAQALDQGDGPLGERALVNLAGAVGEMTGPDRARLAGQLHDAAERLRAGAVGQHRAAWSGAPVPGDDGAKGSEGQPSSAGAQDRMGRELRRLERDLNEAADACAVDPASCRRALEDAAASAGRASNEAQRSAAQEQVARALERAAGRSAGQGDSAPKRQAGRADSPDQEPQNPQSPTRGQLPAGDSAGAQSAGAAPGAPLQGGPSGTGPPAAGPVTMEGATTAGAPEGAGPGRGQGVGDDPQDGPRAPSAGEPRGTPRAVDVASGPGPSRTDVIEASAHDGFTPPAYQPVFRAYQAAVEESLDLEAVPPARRAQVRRYFELIQPR